jgi:hypothetical protein
MAYTHSGMSFDDTSGGAYLTTTNLETAFGTITNNGADPIDVVYYDACMMSMIENLYPLRDFVHYLVASENETFSRYPYNQYLDGIDALTQPSDLASSIVDIYYETLDGYPRTMAAFDLSKIESVAVAVNTLAIELGNSLLEYEHEIQISFYASQKFDSNVDLMLTDEDGYVDLYHFAELIQQNIPLQNVQVAAQEVLDVIGPVGANLVLHERHMSGVYWGNGEYWNLDQAHGLSIYLPMGKEDWMQAYYTDDELSFAADTAWNEFIADLILAVEPPIYIPPDDIDPGHRPGPLDLPYPIYMPFIVRDLGY